MDEPTKYEITALEDSTVIEFSYKNVESWIEFNPSLCEFVRKDTLTGLVFLFEYIGVHIELLKKVRKFFYYFFIFFSTMVTPPDIISQILFSISIILIYELVILLKLVRITIKD